MARIPAVAARSPLRRLAYAYSRRKFGGRLPEPLTVAAQHGGVLWAMAVHESMVERSWRRLDRKLAALAELGASVTIGCPWCIDFGAWLGKGVGLTDSQLRDLPRWRDSDAFSPVERAVLDFAEAASETPMRVTDEMVEGLRAHFDDRQVVELTGLVALENQRSRFNHALGITSQGYTAGDACPVPIG